MIQRRSEPNSFAPGLRIRGTMPVAGLPSGGSPRRIEVRCRAPSAKGKLAKEAMNALLPFGKKDRRLCEIAEYLLKREY